MKSSKDTPPSASAAGAGIYLLAALLLCVALGLGVGWLIGSPTVGAVAGAFIGLPASFYLVYRRYRDL